MAHNQVLSFWQNWGWKSFWHYTFELFIHADYSLGQALCVFLVSQAMQINRYEMTKCMSMPTWIHIPVGLSKKSKVTIELRHKRSKASQVFSVGSFILVTTCEWSVFYASSDTLQYLLRTFGNRMRGCMRKFLNLFYIYWGVRSMLWFNTIESLWFGYLIKLHGLSPGHHSVLKYNGGIKLS